MKRIPLVVCVSVSLIALSGCQSLDFVNTTNRGDVFTAPSYLGKELPSGFLSRDHLYEGSGHDMRGYDTWPRHWKF